MTGVQTCALPILDCFCLSFLAFLVFVFRENLLKMYVVCIVVDLNTRVTEVLSFISITLF